MQSDFEPLSWVVGFWLTFEKPHHLAIFMLEDMSVHLLSIDITVDFIIL